MQVNEIYFMGSNKYGQSGSGERKVESPKLYDFGTFIRQVSCGYHHSALLTITGHVYTMGSNIHGTLGTKQQGLNYSFSPILVDSLENVMKIESGAFHLCALTENGDVYSWGRGMDGQLGHGTNKNTSCATKINIDAEIVEISCGTNHTLMVSDKGEAFAFGNGIYGQLGTGNNKNQLRPVRINIDRPVAMVAAGENHSLFLTTNGEVYGTGDNTAGQVGIGATKKYVLQPHKILELDNVSLIQAAKFSACIQDGKMYVWGGPTQKNKPMLVDNPNSFTELKAGNESLMALTTKGELFSWSNGQMSKMQVCLDTILDFSIGQSHVMILGDIVRTAEQQKDRPNMLKCYERQIKRELKEIKQESNIQRVTLAEQDKENQPKRRGKADLSSKMDTLITETTYCLRELSSLTQLISQLKASTVDPNKNKYILKHLNKENNPYQSEKSSIALIRDKDMKISELQQELSKKQAVIEAYEGMTSALNRLVNAQRHQIESFHQKST